MPVDATLPEYDEYLPMWTAVRDSSEGERAVKAKGEEYLPKLGGHDKDEYAAFKQRASFYNATGRTIDGLSGMIFRKPPEIGAPDGMSAFMEDVTLGGLDFQGFAEGTVEEILSPGRAFVLVDVPRVEVGGITQAQAERMNIRPFLSMYKAESVTYHRVGQIGNKTVLTQVRLKEIASEPVDEFEEASEEQYRVLDLTQDDDGIYYRQRIFRIVENDKGEKEWQQVGPDIVPRMANKRLDYIPGIFIGPKDTTPHFSKPPLIDLADKNFDHYRMDADYHHALHFLAAGMTPWGRGLTDEDMESETFTSTGPTNIWLTTSPEAEFGVLEFTGAGMDSMKDALERAENQMASLGARMLAPEKRQAEAAETASIHRQGEMSVLSSLAQAVSSGLTKALEIARDWMGFSGDAFINLNTDYTPNKMSAQEMAEYTKMLQAGDISYETFVRMMVEGERLPDDLDPEKEQQRIIDNEFAGVEGANVGQV